MADKIFITRHTGAIAWLDRKGSTGWRTVAHFTEQDIENLRVGDIVAGILPIALIIKVQDKTKEWFYSLEMERSVPLELRGKELTADQMDEYGAKLVPITIQYLTGGVIQ